MNWADDDVPPVTVEELDAADERDGIGLIECRHDGYVETFEEWRVTGEPGGGYNPYDYTWTPDREPLELDCEAAARKFIELIRLSAPPWDDGPHIQMRRVQRTAWKTISSDTPSS